MLFYFSKTREKIFFKLTQETKVFPQKHSDSFSNEPLYFEVYTSSSAVVDAMSSAYYPRNNFDANLRLN